MFLEFNCCDFFSITEHWFQDDFIEKLNIGDYNVLDHYSRVNKQHGGVAVFCNTKINAEPIEIIKDLSVELHFLTVAVKYENLISLSIYRSPSGDREVFLRQLDLALEIISKKYENYNVTVQGDFNYSFLVPSPTLNKLLDTLNA